MNPKYRLWLHVKNSLGKKLSVKRKIVAFLVDDYGNVRLNNIQVRKKLKQQGYIDGSNRFDLYDTLETREDLDQLYNVLLSVKDKNGNSACFTPMALSANPNFEALKEYGYDQYRAENIKQSFERKALEEPQSYRGAWELVHEGIKAGIFVPQFHGREHLNVKAFNNLLANRDSKLLSSLVQRSVIGGKYPTNLNLLVAFDFFRVEELEEQHTIIEDGVKLFKKAYGYSPTLFTAPGYRYHTQLEETLAGSGIKGIDTFFTGKEHQGSGRYLRKWRLHGHQNRYDQTYILRNVVFEPTAVQNENDEIGKTLREIEIAFKWGKPAIVSSHRVNFCGHIESANRLKGLNALQSLLKQIVKRWPDVEFLTGGELVSLYN